MKAAGPDGISPRTLKACIASYVGFYSTFSNLTSARRRFLVLWKALYLAPEAKKEISSIWFQSP